MDTIRNCDKCGNEDSVDCESGLCPSCLTKEKDNTTIKIKFKENLSDDSIKMIKEILSGSLGFETEIIRED